MITELSTIQDTLKDLHRGVGPVLKVRTDSDTNFEVAGTKEVMQGKQKVDGHYFASIMPKAKDVRWYFFPIYTHVDHFPELSPELKKCLKGKSCFHIKKMSPEMQSEIKGMIEKGVELYQADGLI